jgi:AraC family transcriptional regulator
MSPAAAKPSPAIKLEPPHFENGKALLIAGLRSHYTPETMNGLPAQWQRFAPHIGRVPGQLGLATYGVSWCPNNSPDVEYLCGVEVSNFSSLPGEFTIVSIPAQRYAVFTHRGHVSTIRETIGAIGTQWFSESGQEPVTRTGEAPDFFELYTEDFDPRTGMGGMEIWIPVKS